MIVMREGNHGQTDISKCFDEWKSVNVPSVPGFPPGFRVSELPTQAKTGLEWATRPPCFPTS